LASRAEVTCRPEVALGILQAAFDRARTARPGAVSGADFTLAGGTVRCRLAGRGLADSVLCPFAHLAKGGSDAPDLTIELWDAEESEVASPLGPAAADLGENGAVTSSSDGRFLAHERPHSVTVLDRADGRLVGFVESSAGLPLVDRGAPLKVPLTVWCSDRDVQLVHAGLVARNGHGVLLPGPRGTGKSTTALACARAGFDFLGDDCVALRVSAEGGFIGHSVYRSTTLLRPPLASSNGVARNRAKSLYSVWETLPRQVTRVVPIDVLALPRIVSGSVPGVRPATKSEALLTLAPSSLVNRAVPAQAALSRMARLVAQVPCYWLEVDRDLAEIPRRLERLLTEAGLT
jgi:hypothetical protein